MKLKFKHWKHGQQEREVVKLPGMDNYFHDRARLYFVDELSGKVLSAGSVLYNNEDGRWVIRHTSPIRIGSDGYVVPNSYEQRGRAAKRWGNQNGFEGRAGGWIYSKFGTAICQGWDEFYHRYYSVIYRDAMVGGGFFERNGRL